jgi:hypothetical protein
MKFAKSSQTIDSLPKEQFRMRTNHEYLDILVHTAHTHYENKTD